MFSYQIYLLGLIILHHFAKSSASLCDFRGGKRQEISDLVIRIPSVLESQTATLAAAHFRA
jgi:hypothetical protein